MAPAEVGQEVRLRGSDHKPGLARPRGGGVHGEVGGGEVERASAGVETLEVLRAGVRGGDEDECAAARMLQERGHAIAPHVGRDRAGVSPEAVVQGRRVLAPRVADVAALAVEDEEAAALADHLADDVENGPAIGPVGLEEGEVRFEGGGEGCS